jgi:hypothetical protein
VLVGELRITASERRAPRSIVAVGRLGSIPFWRKRSITSVAVDPTGSNVAVTGTLVSIEPMWWWSRISVISASSTPGTLCACSAWSTSSTRRRFGLTRSERVTRPIALAQPSPHLHAGIHMACLPAPAGMGQASHKEGRPGL